MGPAPVFENFSENSLKGDLSNDTTDNPPLFSLVNTFKVWWLLSLFLFILSFQFHTFIITFHYHIYHSPRPLSISSLLLAQREKPPWGAEPRFEIELAIQQASALLTELRCTL
jgi:hypothetical protein